MPLLDTGPCQNWPYICDDFPDEPTPEQQALIDQSVQAATEVLWNRTKRRFGTCEKTFRPCREDCSGNLPFMPFPSTLDSTGWGWPFPALISGDWINLACGVCSDHCSCSIVNSVRLPYPVADIVNVTIDGDTLDPSAYRVDNFKSLVRVDGGEWPRCNDVSVADGEPGTWSVTATYGEQVPTIGSQAVGQLASEIFKACPGSGAEGSTCLPVGVVRQVTRQGVQVVMFDGETAFGNGRVGLYFPDLFISTYNPVGVGTATFYDIDGPRRYNAGSLPGPVPAP